MNNENREIVRRLLRGDELTLLYGENKILLGYWGKNATISVNNEFGKFLIENYYVELSSGNEHYKEENYVASDKLRQSAWNMIYTVGDTVEYWHVYDGRKKGVITKADRFLGLQVYLDGVENVEYTATDSVIGRTRRVLTEKTIENTHLEYDVNSLMTPRIGAQPSWLKSVHG